MAPSFCWGSLAFLVTVLGFLVFLGTARCGGASASQSVSRFVTDAHNLTNITLKMQDIGSATLHDLSIIQSSCGLPKSGINQIRKYKAKIQDTVDQLSMLHAQLAILTAQIDGFQLFKYEQYMSTLHSYTFRDFKFMPRNITNKVENKVEELPGFQFQGYEGAKALWKFILVTLTGPLVLITFICAIMLFILCGISCMRQGSSCAKCGDIVFFKIGSLGLALTILGVAVLSGAQLAAGIILSSFCADADANALLMLDENIGPGSRFYNEDGPGTWKAARYYIGDKGSNPYMTLLTSASASLHDMSHQWPDVQLGIWFYCGYDYDSTTAADRIGGNLQMSQKHVNDTMTILAPAHIYRYYTDAMHHQICGPVIDGLAWVALSQIVAGMICLPCLSCTVKSFVHRRGLEHERQTSLLPEDFYLALA